MFKTIKKFLSKQIFFTSFLIASIILGIKIFVMPDRLEFIEPISIYAALLSSVIFIYGFMISPAVSEYKESEKIRGELKSTIENIILDIDYFKQLKNLDTKSIYGTLSEMLEYVFYRIADDVRGKSINTLMKSTNHFLIEAEESGITANHIIRMKGEFGNLRRNINRLLQIKDGDSLPSVVHKLKNFITVFIITTLLFLNIGDMTHETIFGDIKEGIIIFILTFIYTYLSLIINNLENPFDKRNFSGYIDMSFLLNYAQNIKKDEETKEPLI